MAPTRRRDLLTSRRRMADAGEEDDPETASVGQVSQSEASVLSDGVDSLDADDSEASDGEHPDPSKAASIEPQHNTVSKSKPQNATPATSSTVPASSEPANPAFKPTADTHAMMNGLKPPTPTNDSGDIHFDDAAAVVDDSTATKEPSALPAQAKPPEPSTPAPGVQSRDTQQVDEVKRGENQVPKRQWKREKTDNGPTNATLLSRNNAAHRANSSLAAKFDQNSSSKKNAGPGHGSDENVPASYVAPFTILKSSRQLNTHIVRRFRNRAPADNQRWDHDLHESITNSQERGNPPTATSGRELPAPLTSQTTPSVSRTILLGTVNIRIVLPGMEKARIIEKVAVKQHTRLPDIRPPLRRDKPVRVALPEKSPKYIFPSVPRSFIFIPRAQRPNQQGSRIRGRGPHSHHGSRRTSIYGGSNYTPSVALSRRSSQARDGMMSPIGSTMSRPQPNFLSNPSRPVVKLPAGMQPNASPNSNQNPSASVNSHPQSNTFHPTQNYPLPSRPTLRENRAHQIPMHQPRPQKSVSVPTVESPGPEKLPGPQQQEQQPFYHQVPAHFGTKFSPRSQNPSLAQSQFMPLSEPHVTGTPTTNIPERAVDAQPFQPNSQPPAYQQPFPAQNVFYYPSSGSQSAPYGADQNVASPMYMPTTQQGGYLVPVMMPPGSAAHPQGPPAASNGEQVTSGANGFAPYEFNGTMYYQDPSQFNSNADGGLMTNYTMPGPGGIMTPTPEGYYYGPPPQPIMYYQS